MRPEQVRHRRLIDVITIILEVLLASLFLFSGVANLIRPDVPVGALGENSRVCATLILAAAFLVFSLFRPYLGGLLLCVAAVPFGFVFHFRFPFSVAAGLVLLLGVLSIIRGRLSRRAVSKASEQASGSSEST